MCNYYLLIYLQQQQFKENCFAESGRTNMQRVNATGMRIRLKHTHTYNNKSVALRKSSYTRRFWSDWHETLLSFIQFYHCDVVYVCRALRKFWKNPIEFTE